LEIFGEAVRNLKQLSRTESNSKKPWVE